MIPATFHLRPSPLSDAGRCPNWEGARVQIQYLGFQTKPRGRDYLYCVIDAKSGKREFTFGISSQAFADKRVPYQDAADLCYQKLRKAPGLETPEQPFPRDSTFSNQEREGEIEPLDKRVFSVSESSESFRSLRSSARL
jgi:hypothetical protein